ncbi:M14 family metallopeptidase [Bacillus salitolerans]|uniref:M14 family metallopeptidase n=1 Tax=Bacillus salitolerans TaxID=1437434 RepID=A0ABW4LPC9_9BACI
MKVTVRQGDTLFYYSQLYEVPLYLLIQSNHVDPMNLKIGSEVYIPGFVKNKYVISAGDNLAAIAQNRNTSLDALILLNPTINPNELQTGQHIFVPTRVTDSLVKGKQEYDYPTLVTDIQRLRTVFPFIKVHSIGKSVLNKDLYEIKIGTGDKHIHINGSFHANEWITTSVIMQFVNDYLLALTNFGSINGHQMEPYFHKVTLSIVPMVNPDGVDLVLNGLPEKAAYHSEVLEINGGSHDFRNWKANIRGVDLNNQYPSYWEIEKGRKEPKSPAPRDYPGDAPLSEPESIAIAELTKTSDFSMVVAFHTQGKEIYWGYLNHEPPIAESIVNEFERVSGYKAVKDIDSHAGFRDWFILTYRRPGYTVELGEGVNPLPISQFDEIYKQSIGIFLASLYMI